MKKYLDINGLGLGNECTLELQRRHLTLGVSESKPSLLSHQECGVNMDACACVGESWAECWSALLWGEQRGSVLDGGCTFMRAYQNSFVCACITAVPSWSLFPSRVHLYSNRVGLSAPERLLICAVINSIKLGDQLKLISQFLFCSMTEIRKHMIILDKMNIYTLFKRESKENIQSV